MASEEDGIVFKHPLALKPLRRPGVKPVPAAEATETNNNSVMWNFKLRTLNATLHFVKNDSSSVLKYDDLSIEQAEFVTGLIAQCTTQSSVKEMDVGFGFKGIFAPLAEAMTIFGLKYEFQLTKETSLNDMKQLKLQKIPKNGTVADNNLSATSSSKMNTAKTKKHNNPSRKILKAIERVDETFQQSTIQQMKQFLDDNSRESLRFDEITPKQMRFIKRMKTIPHKLECIEQFDVGTRILLDDIRHTLQKNTHKFRIEVYQEKNEKGQPSCAVMWKLGVGKMLTRKEKQVLNTSGSSANDSSDTSFTSTCSEQSNSSRNKRKQKKTVLNKSDTALKPNNTDADKSKPNDDLVLKSLTKLKDFLSDNAQASFMIPQASKVHTTFLENVLRELYEVERFPQKIGTVLKAVYSLVNQNRNVFKVMGKKSNIGKKNDKCDLTLIKIPVYPKLKPRQHISRIDTVSSANKSQNNPNSATKIQKKQTNEMNEIQNVLSTAAINKDQNVLKLSTAKKPLEPSATRSVSLTRKNANQNKNWRDRSVEYVKSSSNLTTAPIQEARSMTSLVQETSVTSRVQGSLTSQPGPKLNRAKVKLIEGLNQPVVSEKGLKMMQMMGWQGGALGARGEGIVEPISLSLDTARRSGFGHISQQTTTKLPTMDLYTQLPTTITRVHLGYFAKKDLATSTLEAVLDLLTTEKGAIEVIFFSQISAKGWSYVKHIVTSLNSKNRKSLFTCADCPVLIEGIMRVMPATNFVVTACWGQSKTNILFVRHKGLYDPRDNNNWCSVIAFENIQKILKNTVIVNKDLKENPKSTENTKYNTENVQVKTKDNQNAQENAKAIDYQNTTDNKMVDGDTFRYYILVQILEFCNRSDISIDKGQTVTAEKKIQLKGSMNSKQVGFVKDLVQRLNNRARPSSDSKTERSIFKEILQEMAGFDLNVVFPVADNFSDAFKTIILKKVPTEKFKHPTTDQKRNENLKSENDDVYETLKKANDCPNMFDLNHFAEVIDNNLKYVKERLFQNDKENVNNNSRNIINRNAFENDKTEIIKVRNNNKTKSDKNYEIPKICNKRQTFTHDSFGPEFMFENQNDENNDDLKNCLCCVSNDVEMDDSDDVIIIENGIEVIVIDDDSDEFNETEEKNNDKNHSQNNRENYTQNDIEETVIDSWEDIIDESNSNTDITSNTEKVLEVNDENYTCLDKNDIVQEKNDVGQYKNNIVQDENNVGRDENEVVRDDNESRTDSPVSQISKSIDNLDLESPIMTSKIVENNIHNINNNDIHVTKKDYVCEIDDILNIDDSKYDKNSSEILITADHIMQKLQNLSNMKAVSNDTNKNTSCDLEIQKDINFNNNEFLKLMNADKELPKQINADQELPKQMNADQELSKQTNADQELPKQMNADQELSKQTNTDEELPRQMNADQELSKQTNADQELPKQMNADQELSKQTNADEELPKQMNADQELSKQTNADQELSKQTNADEELPKQMNADQELSKQTNADEELSKQMNADQELSKQINAGEESQTCEKESCAGKRRSNSSFERTSKKCRYEEYNIQINITPKNYPQSKIDIKTAGKIQNSIVQSIDNSQELPLLKCHGIKDGALVYSCHSEKSLHSLEYILQSFHDLKMEINEEIEENNRYKMAFRINTFIDETVDDILSRLELYNNGLNTDDWLFLKKEQCSDFTVLYVEMDVVSFNYIRASKFCMYAGIDEAKFSVVWT